MPNRAEHRIAIVGMACRVPGALTVEKFWQNLRAGIESITFFDEAEFTPGLENAAGERLVKAAGLLPEMDCFDAAFFDTGAKEAELMDPQHRVFLECSWEALESAGYDPKAFPGSIGVYGSAGLNRYLLHHVCANPEYFRNIGAHRALIGNDKDFLATRVSYKLGLTGPSLSVQTACSSSLAAVHLACQALLNGECDMALAGGVSIPAPERAGYIYTEGGIGSPDGHCRAFDASARGTVPASGCGIVTLRRLADAIEDRCTIHAVILGSAMNNDGGLKPGYTAPSVAGQAAALEEAVVFAGVAPHSIGFIEAHATGTEVGDPVEFAAIAKVYGATQEPGSRCAIGSVKTNIGHLDTAAGIAGLIKAALAVERGEIPPTLHFRAPHPEVRLEGSRFYVNTETVCWNGGDARRAAVSSFGIGGTNVHLVLEEPPRAIEAAPAEGWHLLLLSAKTPPALEAASERLAARLAAGDNLDLANVAFTLARGRRPFAYRRAILCRTRLGAEKAIRAGARIEAAADLPVDSTLERLARAWESGANIDVDSSTAFERGKRIPLPAYPFERKRYWIGDARGRRQAGIRRKDDPQRWVYTLDWREAPPARPAEEESREAVVFASGEWREALQQALATRGTRIADELGRNAAPPWVIYASSPRPGSNPSGELDAFLQVARQLAALAQRTRVDILVRAGQPASTMLAGAARALVMEYPALECRTIHAAGDPVRAASELERELFSDSIEPEILLQNGRRYAWSATRLENAAGGGAPRRQGGVYLITGGLGKVASRLAAWLAESAGARLVLVGRPAVEDNDVRLASLRGAGAEVAYVRGDCAEPGVLHEAVRVARERWGALHGVFHLAGISGRSAYRLLRDCDPTFSAEVLRAKTMGAIALEQALGDTPLDFCVLFSSLASRLGGLGLCAYAAANRFLDDFAALHNRRSPVHWTSVDWESWRTEPFSKDAAAPATGELALTPDQGFSVLGRILQSAKLGQVMVSTADFTERQRVWKGPPAGPPAAVARDAEGTVTRLWCEALGCEQGEREVNFFDLGGNSLIGLELADRIGRSLGLHLPGYLLFEAPTLSSLIARIKQISMANGSVTALPRAAPAPPAASVTRPAAGIAIIGAAGRFPGANNLAEFWRNLRNGVESIRFFDRSEILSEPRMADLAQDPRFVPAAALLEDIESFDAAFFQYAPREAELLDPQHRVLLECVYEALEDAGCDPERAGSIAIYAGGSSSTYLYNIYMNALVRRAVTPMQVAIGNDRDALATTISYKLNLRGPSINVQTFCSTSLVGVHLARESLLRRECDIAIAAGVSINIFQRYGYLCEEGGILSPDGHCRAFDGSAQGTIFGDGAGAVVLRRLEDAIAGGSRILAVIRGSAVNNDGALKSGYTAPGVDSQAEVVRKAIESAGVSARSISYVEAHGTGTRLGDPIEITALSRAFRAWTADTEFAAIGSVKTNVGHLDRAAGISGLLKTVLALQNREIPPSLHFEHPNREIDFGASPFYVARDLKEWASSGGAPRRAGVTALGIGGTNAHVVIEEAPEIPRGPERPCERLLVLSARTGPALDRMTSNLEQHLHNHPRQRLDDLEYTLQCGRKAYGYRRALVCGSREEAAGNWAGAIKGASPPQPPRMGFLFPGQGAQYPLMGAGLYSEFPVFRQAVDRCAGLAASHLGFDLCERLFGAATPEAALSLRQTAAAQPALFAIEYAVAQLFGSWGVRPRCMLGHSIGEYVAACLAGVFSLEDAVTLVCHRGRLMQAAAPGVMVAVEAEAAELEQCLPDGLSIAAINGGRSCVVSGPAPGCERMERICEDEGWPHARLRTSHAFHSAMMDPVLDEFRECVSEARRSEPAIPFLSNLTGDWITREQAVSTEYWVRHLRSTVQFAAGIQRLAAQCDLAVELGPGNTLTSLAAGALAALPTMPGPRSAASERALALSALGRLWVEGCEIQWAGLQTEDARICPLPAYPFERRKFWVQPGAMLGGLTPPERKPDPADWLYMPTWRRAGTASFAPRDAGRVLVLHEGGAAAAGFLGALEEEGSNLVVARIGAELRDASRESFTGLLRDLDREGRWPKRVVYFAVGARLNGIALFESLLALVQALSMTGDRTLELTVVAANSQEVTGGDLHRPEHAMALGITRVAPREYPGLSCRYLDVDGAAASVWHSVASELRRPIGEPVVALRGAYRWVQRVDAIAAPSGSASVLLRRGGAYLITGGLGGIGLEIAGFLASEYGARVALCGRSAPPRERWDELIANGDRALAGRLVRARAIAERADLMVGQADVADWQMLKRFVTGVRERFGRIDGVLHSAGIAGGGVIQLKTPQAAARVFAPKVAGTLNLAQLFSSDPPDFMMLCSSIASLTGDFGQSDYCAANSFLDAFARWMSATQGVRTIAVNWGAWREAGMAVHTEIPEELKAARSLMLANGIAPADGVKAFRHALEAGEPQVIVTPRHPDALMEAASRAGSAEESGVTAAGGPSHQKPRPPLPYAYSAPSNKAEELLAEIWQEFLQIEQIGIDDNFFDLGGNSLMAIQLIPEIRRRTGASIRSTDLFEKATVRLLATLLQDGADDGAGVAQSIARGQMIRQARGTRRS